jgi:hypothetical protein
VIKISRLLAAAALTALVLGPAAFATADDHKRGGDSDSDRPSAQTDPASAVGDSTATLNGHVSDKRKSTEFRFEYGVTTSYGQSTSASRTADKGSTSTVTATIAGLAPDTVYHFRLRAWNDGSGSTDRGDDRSFTTTTAPPAAPAAGTTSPTGLPLSNAPAEPVQGGWMVVAPLVGTVKIKPPGATDYATLAAGDAVPIGTLVDTRRGTVKLTSELRGGTTQSGAFHGALFQVRQASTGSGMTDLVLRGQNFTLCPRQTNGVGVGVRAASTSRPPLRRLWARDKGGRFRTHGRTSVATVRGTSWATTDTCAGTRTTVKSGSVAVRDRRRGKTIIVRRGQSYLARSPR